MSRQVDVPKVAWSKRGIRVGSCPCHHAVIAATSSASAGASVGERVGPVGGDRDDRVDLLRGDDVGPVGRRLTGPAPPGGKGGWREPQRGCKNAECDELTHALRA